LFRNADYSTENLRAVRDAVLPSHLPLISARRKTGFHVDIELEVSLLFPPQQQCCALFAASNESEPKSEGGLNETESGAECIATGCSVRLVLHGRMATLAERNQLFNYRHNY
jgi:hypothetical protein